MTSTQTSVLDLTQRYKPNGRNFTKKQHESHRKQIAELVDRLLIDIDDDLQNWENPQRFCSHSNCDGKEHSKGYFYQVEKITCSSLFHDRDEVKSDDGGNNYYCFINVDEMPNGSCPDTDDESVVVVTHVGKVDYSVEKMLEKITSRVKRTVKEYMKNNEVKFLNDLTYGGKKLHVRTFNASTSNDDVNVAIWIGK